MRMLSPSTIEMDNYNIDLRTEVAKLLAQLSQRTSPDAIIDQSSIISRDYMYSGILTDSGAGRISSGLYSLELLAIQCAGVDPNQLFLFDAVIYSGSASEFKSANEDKLLELVLVNLGMLEIIESMDVTITADYIDLCKKIGKKVKAGSFKSSQYKRTMIKQSKALINIYIRGQA